MRRRILPTPATTGANVRTTGTKRASTMVLAPWWSKKSSVRSMYSRLKNRESGRRNSRGPTVAPMVNPTWSPITAAAKQPMRTAARLSLPWLARMPGGEEERVAGEEEAEQEAGFGEDDEHQPDLAVGAQSLRIVLGRS